MKMTLTPLDSPLWEVYRGAYGNVREEVAILAGPEKDAPEVGRLRRLDTAEKSDFQVAFDNLCENLSHQMTFYEAIYLALPYMVKLLSRKIAENDFTWQVNIFSEIGCCLATDIPNQRSQEFETAMPPEILESYQAAILRLQEYAKKFVLNNADKIGALPEWDREFLLVGLLGVFGNHALASILILSDDNNCGLACPNCDFYDDESYLDDPDFQAAIETLPTEPWDGQSFDQPQVWLPALLAKLGGSEKLNPELLPYYFGNFTCPECGHQAPLLEFAQNCYFGD
ncbi:MAG: hypothetical protein HFJ96_05845 [Peptococcaceae bacterium]|jgi:hypothetical protein|nr:hypothetical protein [Peptococcaceae bacterium]